MANLVALGIVAGLGFIKFGILDGALLTAVVFALMSWKPK